MGSLGLDRLVDVQALESLLSQLARALKERQLKLVTAESCTGGLVAGACTSIAGSSDWFERGFITYSNEAKAEQLGVPAEVIDRHGAVSREVAIAMAQGALQHSRAQSERGRDGHRRPGWRRAGQAGRHGLAMPMRAARTSSRPSACCSRATAPGSGPRRRATRSSGC